MLVRQNSFVLLEKIREQRSFSLPRGKKIYRRSPPFYRSTLVLFSPTKTKKTKKKKEEPVILAFGERGSAIDDESKRSYESRPNYTLPSNPLIVAE